MSFFKELKRRNVVRVGIAYTVATWLLIQVVDIVFPRIGLPDSAVISNDRDDQTGSPDSGRKSVCRGRMDAQEQPLPTDFHPGIRWLPCYAYGLVGNKLPTLRRLL